jgi:hypothetical protein
MHLELVVPALFEARSPAPSLELLLARGRRTGRAQASLEEWLAGAFGLSGPLPAGALTAHASGAPAAEGHWLRADPVHLRADGNRVLLLPGEGLDLSEAESQALLGELNRHFADQFSVAAVAPDRWILRAASVLTVETRPPLEASGGDGGAQPPERRLRALLAEIQMALYQHEVNTRREARGAPVVNSVWLWGAGPLPEAAALQDATPWRSVSASDPAALGLAKLAGLRHRAPGEGAEAWLERAPEDGRHVVLLDALRAGAALGDAEALATRMQALEERWFAPLLTALRTGRIGMFTLHAPEAGASFETVRGDLRRFWRRPRPLASYAPERGYAGPEDRP